MRSLTLLILLLTYALVNAQSPIITGKNQKFIHYEVNDGRLVLLESLEPGMTIYSISRKYNLSIDQLLQANPGLDPGNVPLGYPVNIPIARDAIHFENPSAAEDMLWLSYRVQAKETLYRISKVYLGASPEIIITLNPSAEQGIKIGQVLHVGWLPMYSLRDEDVMLTHDSVNTTPVDFIKTASTEGKKICEQKGLAVWKPGNATSNYYVLHPTAKVGSYMEITNPMLHRTITAKVSGNIPPGLYQSHVGIVVSPSTARALGVLDQHFFARWRYIE